MSCSKNELINIQDIESVEGEYLSRKEYQFKLIEQAQEQALKDSAEFKEKAMKQKEELCEAQLNLQAEIYANMFGFSKFKA